MGSISVCVHLTVSFPQKAKHGFYKHAAFTPILDEESLIVIVIFWVFRLLPSYLKSQTLTIAL